MEGKQLILFALAIVIAILTTIVVILRCAVRASIKGFGWDDYTMILGQLLLYGALATTWWACISGMGVKDVDLSIGDFIEVRHAMVYVESFYLISYAFVKSSIGFAILRIATNKAIHYTVYVLMFTSWCSGLVPVVVILTFCHPLSAAWTSEGHCASSERLVKTAIYLSVTAIINDVALCILPFVMLWNLQMNKKRKFTIAAVLALGAIASVATMVRIYYIPRFTSKVNYAWGYADLIIWCLIEAFIAITVGSVPALSPLLVKLSLWSNRSSRPKGASSKGGRQEDNALESLKPVMVTQITARELQSNSATDVLGEDEERQSAVSVV